MKKKFKFVRTRIGTRIEGLNKEQEQKSRVMFQEPRKTRTKGEQSKQILNKNKINKKKFQFERTRIKIRSFFHS